MTTKTAADFWFGQWYDESKLNDSLRADLALAEATIGVLRTQLANASMELAAAKADVRA